MKIELDLACQKSTKTSKEAELSRLAGYARDILKVANARGGLEVARLPTKYVFEVLRVGGSSFLPALPVL